MLLRPLSPRRCQREPSTHQDRGREREDRDHFEPDNATRSPGSPVDAPEQNLRKAPAVASWLKRRATHPNARVRWAANWIEDLV